MDSTRLRNAAAVCGATLALVQNSQSLIRYSSQPREGVKKLKVFIPTSICGLNVSYKYCLVCL
jgi:hypothetical protein